MNSSIIKAAACLIAAAATACTYKELCWNHHHGTSVAVVFDWSGERNRAGISGMSIEFMTTGDCREPGLHFDLAGTDGGNVWLPHGSYRAFAWNTSGSVMVMYEGGNDSGDGGLVATTRSGSLAEGTQIVTRADMPKAPGTEDERVLIQPDPIWSGISEPFEVQAIASDPAGKPTVILPMAKLTTTVSMTILNVSNLEYAGEFGASLSGLAAGAVMGHISTLANNETAMEKVTMATPLYRAQATTLAGTMECFGPSQQARHILTVYAILADGTKWYSSIDVSSQVREQTTEQAVRQIDITVSSLPLPRPIEGGSGFEPEVDSWQEVTINIGM